MSTARSRRLGVLAAALGALLILPATAFAGSASRTLQGTLVAAHGDSFGQTAASSKSIWHDTLVTANGKVTLSFSGTRPAGFYNGARVRVRGTMSGSILKVGGNKADAQVTQNTVVAAPSAKKLAVLLVKFADTDPEPYTISQVQQVMFSNSDSVANYFNEESYGQLTMTGDVFGYFTISTNTVACDFTDIGNKARAAAAAAGIDLSSYTQIQYLHNYLSSCGWAGLAYVPGRDSWINQYLGLRVPSHELSHNLGVHHASTMSCTVGGVRVTLSANSADCSSSEYGDPFSVMGSATSRHTHNQQLASLTWLSGGALQTVSTSGTYQLASADLTSSASPRAVRVPRGSTGTWFYLELRSPTGTNFDTFSPSDPAVTGVSIRISNDWGTIIQSQLLDTTPGTSSYLDAPLQVGQSFTDPLSGVTITTVSVADGVATVNVSWGADGVAPSTPTNINVASTGNASARVTWSASTDNVGVAGYRVYRDSVLKGTVTSTSFDDSGLTGGSSYTYKVEAFDAAGNTSFATRAWTQPIPDTTAPTNPTNLKVSSLTKAKATFTWTASTDATGVAGYRIFRNGVQVATTTALTWSDARQRTASTYYVVAYDSAGNVSGASNSVAVARK
jgi:chitodextrinase